MKKLMLILLLTCIQCCVYADDSNGYQSGGGQTNGYQSNSYGATPYSSSPSGSTNSYDSSGQTWQTNRSQNDTSSGSDSNGNTWISPEPPATPDGSNNNDSGN